MTEGAIKAATSARVRREWNEMKGKGLEGRKGNAMKKGNGKNEWMNEWMNERTNEWMNEWMNEWVNK